MRELAALVRRAIGEKRELRLPSQAFTEIVVRFQDMVFGYALARLRDAAAAQDAAQETFIAAYRKLETLRDPGAFPAWIRRIAARCCLMELRRRKEATLAAGQAEELASGYADPHTLAASEETRSEIREAIDRLPEVQRLPVVLYYMDGYSQGQIAEFLDVQVSAVKKRLQRGRERMRKELMKKVREDLASIRPSRSGQLVERVSLYTGFEAAARLGQIAVLEQMLVDGVEVNRPDASGRTLLHWAVDNRHVDAVRLLLRSGAEADIPDRSGRTARQAAAGCGEPEIQRLLREPGPGSRRS